MGTRYLRNNNSKSYIYSLNIKDFSHESHFEIPLAQQNTESSPDKLNPSKFSINDDEDLSAKFLYKSVPFNVSQTYPLTGSESIAYDSDIVTDILERKETLDRRLPLLQNYDKCNPYKPQNEIPAGDKDYDLLAVPYYTKELHDLVSKGDQYFSGTYNWYFTGGSLHLELEDGKALLIYGNRNNHLIITEIARESTGLIARSTQHFEDLQNNGTIFEIISNVVDRQILLGVRQKLIFTVLNLTTNPIKINILNEHVAKAPIVSVAFNRFNPEQIFLANVKKKIVALDNELKNATKLSYPKTDRVVDNFMRIKSLDTHKILYANQKEFKSLDVRTNNAETIHKPDSKSVFACDYIVNFESSPSNSNYYYLTTQHNVFKVDARKRGVVNRWSHLLRSSPCFIDVTTKDDAEIVCVSSQLSHEKIVLGASLNATFWPKILTSAANGLEQVHLRGKLLIDDHLNARAKHCTTGLKLFRTDDCISVLSCNALGDIFCCDLLKTDDGSCSSSNLCDKFELWANDIPTSNSPLIVDNFAALNYVYHTMTESKDKKSKRIRSDRKKVVVVSKTYERVLKNMKINFHPLAVDLAKCWGYDDLSKVEENITLPDAPLNNRVEEWLLSQSNTDNDVNK